MSRQTSGHGPRLSLRVEGLAIVAVIVATAVPAAIGPPVFRWWRWDVSDILANILLYLPVGFVLGGYPLRRTLLAAALLSGAIEAAQLFYVNRIGHPIDTVVNVWGTWLGHCITPYVRLRPEPVRVGRVAGCLAMVAAGGWVLSSRTFLMYVGGYGWFAAERAHPRFWAWLPAEVIRVGVEIHELGVLANTAVAGLLAAGGAIALVQVRPWLLRALVGGLAGFAAGTMMTPNLNVFPTGPATIGTCAGLAAAYCLATREAHG